jgi:hypothetical protein
VPAASVPEAQRYVVIPGQDGPRWIVPVDWSLSKAVLQQWTPINPVSRAKWRAVLMAHRLGCIERIPNTTVIGLANLDFSDWHRRGLTRSANVLPIAYVARPSTTQKAIVNLLSLDTGAVDGVVKVALGPWAKSSIERDYRNLQMLEQFCSGLAPRPIGLAPELEMTSQEWAAGKTRLRPPISLAANYLETLWQTRTTSLRNLAQRYYGEFTTLPFRDVAGHIERMFDSIRCDDPVPAAFYHGDFVSWNLICRDDFSCCAIDWEFGDPDGAPLLDLFHFLLRFPLAAGKIDSYQAASRLTLAAHGTMVNAALDRIGASSQYAENALTLSFIAIYLTRFKQICGVERIQPQLQAVARTFGSGYSLSAATPRLGEKRADDLTAANWWDR